MFTQLLYNLNKSLFQETVECTPPPTPQTSGLCLATRGHQAPWGGSPEPPSIPVMTLRAGKQAMEASLKQLLGSSTCPLRLAIITLLSKFNILEYVKEFPILNSWETDLELISF